ncbi:MAG: hypothetical protein KDG89_15195 [Geminicoccaceae bacterium]|nr:hypothetical protein [Geminicoccaceae bacterium]
MTTFCFALLAESHPASLPRVLNAVALTGLVPESCHAQQADGEIAIDLQVDGLDAEAAAKLALRLGRIVAVSNVLWGEKRRARRAA